MTWIQIAALGILITGAVIASALGNKEMGLLLAGAGIGFAVNRPPNGGVKK